MNSIYLNYYPVKVQWIVLAGYMRLVNELITAYEGRILNIHPSLLPKFKVRCHRSSVRKWNTVTGSTVHYVDSGMDTGEILNNSNVI